MKSVVKNVVTSKCHLSPCPHCEYTIMWGGEGVVSPLYPIYVGLRYAFQGFKCDFQATTKMTTKFQETQSVQIERCGRK
jgi:hypothetical protein